MQHTPSTKQHTRRKASSQVSDYHTIKKALLNRAGRRCASCYRKTVPVRLVRDWRKKESLTGQPYILLCHDCIIKRQEKRKEKKKRLWRRKASKRKLTKESWLNKIRPKVLERDNYTCVWCGTKELVGLGSLIPESRGGKRCIENYVACCQKCRPSKGNMLPLEYLWKDIDLNEYLNEQLDYGLIVKADPGKHVQIKFFLLSEISQFLHKLTNNKVLPSKVRTRAEILNVKLLS